MKKRIFALVLAVVMVASASMAIYAGVNGFGGESEYIAAEATLDCCAPEFTPDGCPYLIIVNGCCGQWCNWGVWCPKPPQPCCWGRCDSWWCGFVRGNGGRCIC